MASRLVKPHSAQERLTSLSAQAGKLVCMNAVRESFARHLARQLGYARTQTYTGHPLLRREIRRVFVDA